MAGQKEQETITYTCEHCGHTGDKARHDDFSKIRGVKRYLPGDALCFKCGSPIPYELQ